MAGAFVGIDLLLHHRVEFRRQVFQDVGFGGVPSRGSFEHANRRWCMEQDQFRIGESRKLRRKLAVLGRVAVDAQQAYLLYVCLGETAFEMPQDPATGAAQSDYQRGIITALRRLTGGFEDAADEFLNLVHISL